MRVSNKNITASRLTGLIILGLSLMTASLSAAEQEAKTDLRVLVDVSGSMKQNDPENLRRTALRLLIGLVPEEARVGMWSFAQYVNMQVKPGFASKAWKKNARNEADKIHSRGLFTNIEATLDKSTWDWRKPDTAWNRHLILLTDGQVDVSKDNNKNTASRDRILKELLPKLKAAGVKIHTVALSKNADHDLLRTLATESDAWYEPVETAEGLQKVFLRLFEKSTPTDNLPLDGNRFEVDKSIEDMTVLVFHAKGANATRVIRPDNSSFQHGQIPNNVAWHHDKGFDLITVHKPEAGSWSIDAEMDPDNRVQVVTNLKLRVGDIPNNILKGEALDIHAELKENEGLVSNKQILELVDVDIVSKLASATNDLSMQPAEKAGTYSVQLNGLDETGAMELTVRATGPTFRRESRHSVRVHESPLHLDISEKDGGFLITVAENQELIQSGTLGLTLSLDDETVPSAITRSDTGTWQASLGQEYAGRHFTIEATASLSGDRPFESQLHGQLPEPEAPFVDPLTIWAEEHKGEIIVQVLEMPNVLQTGTLDLKLQLPEIAELKMAETKQILQVEPHLWRLPIEPDYAETEVTIQANGHLLNGKPYQLEHKLTLPVIRQPEVSQQLESPAENQEEAPKTEAGTPVEKQGRNWLVITISLVIINALIGVGGFFAYRYWKRRDHQVDDELGEQEEHAEKTASNEPEEESISFDEEVDVIGAASASEAAPPAGDDKPGQNFAEERRPQPDTPVVDLNEVVETDVDDQDQDNGIPTLTDTADTSSEAGTPVENIDDDAVADEWAAALTESADAETEAEAPAESSDDDAVADEWAAALAESGDAETEAGAPAESSDDDAVADEWAAALAESGDAETEAEAPAESSDDDAVADEWAAALAEAESVPSGEDKK
ncbi:VWA domain-containing protein [Sulfuriflexus sp.]|uniref:VWA domain-containing protein n=1 Tax=Sulfuriflexus sp. TaxID=2015443 RepID=UPI0028CF8829|nr:VWA domain-containing protein [Sulfuriflexus sp.]MDT8403616.1 VWA domain-containing protein [Sulfuriflexus sp.]